MHSIRGGQGAPGPYHRTGLRRRLSAEVGCLPPPQVELEQAFKLFDADQSGFVTADEIRHYMTSAGGAEALTQAECDEMILMADPNNDGKVSLEEFRDMECWKIPEDTMRARRATPRPPAAAEPAES